MGFLRHLLSRYQDICIQCHNDPDADALASALGLYRYLSAHGAKVQIVYGGPVKLNKFNIDLMVRQCQIPIRHVEVLPPTQLLLVVDGQYGEGNVARFDAPAVAVIDHHFQRIPDGDLVLVRSDYQSCATIVWELLTEEGWPVERDERLCVALLYGLYTDTASYADLYCKPDLAMYTSLTGNYPLLERLKKSCLTVEELMITSDALQNHYFDAERCYAIIPAIHCEQVVLGVIGDLVIQVDQIRATITYTESDISYQISIRTCDESIQAEHLAAAVCAGVGSGGGRSGKAGGRLFKEALRRQYGEGFDIFAVIKARMDQAVPPEVR